MEAWEAELHLWKIFIYNTKKKDFYGWHSATADIWTMEAWEAGLAKGGKKWGGQMHTASLSPYASLYS